MKKIWFSVVIILAIFIGSIFYISYLNNFTLAMKGYAKTAYENIEKDSSKVPENLNLVLAKLDSNQMLLCAFIDHKLLNEIEDGAKASLEFYQNGESNNLRLELVLLAEKIDHIKDVEILDLKNIL